MHDSQPENGIGKPSPGLNCPRCGSRIPLSIETLLQNTGVSCSQCGLELTVDRAESRQALDALQRLYDGIQEAHRINAATKKK